MRNPNFSLLLWLCLCSFVSPLAGRGQRRRSRTHDAVKYNAATALPLDAEKDQDLQILWGMAGQTSRRKQLKNGRRTTTTSSTSSKSSQSLPKNNQVPSILEDEIESVIIDSPARATIQLTNGTTYRANPQEYHQRKDFHVWMKTRQALDVSASELSALTDNSYFTTRDQLLQKKTTANPKAIPFVANSKACQWGLKMEPLAFQQYTTVTNYTVIETGLWIQQYQSTNNHNNLTIMIGASPDGIVHDPNTNTTGLLEIKSLWSRRHNKELPLMQHCPSRFLDQIQGQLAVCDKPWCDLMLFVPPRHKHCRNYNIIRVERDQEYWDKTLFPAVQQFCKDIQAIQ